MSAESTSSSWLFRVLREPANTITHFAGIVFAVIGMAALLLLSAGDPRRLIAFTIYGVSLVVLYTASTLLHGLRVEGATLRRLRIFDHAAIFGLIAGTYTPITLITLQRDSAAWGWALFGAVWGFALLGIVFKIFWIGAPRWFSTGLYLLMGWLALVAIVPIVRALPAGGIAWLVAGGVFYSVGAVIYASKRPDPLPDVFGYHALWHLFVLAGSACHFAMMLRYVLPT